MTNADSSLPQHRRSQAGEPPADVSVTAPTMSVPMRTDEIGAAAETPTSAPSRSVTEPPSKGSARARALKSTLRTPNGFFTAVHTAELLAKPVGLRPPLR